MYFVPQAELAGESACPTSAGKRLAGGGAGAFACERHHLDTLCDYLFF
jgi:hypothetical protein